jgi:sugar phosphate isomerase/epimerase
VTKPRSLALVAGAVVLLAGCGGGRHAYHVPVTRAFAAHGLPVYSLNPPLYLFSDVKDIRAARTADRMGAGQVSVVVFTTEKAAKAYDDPRAAALIEVETGRARNVVVTYEHVSPAEAKRIRETLRALR